MKVPPVEKLLILDGAIISALLFYIFLPSIKGAIICFIIVLSLQLIFYYLVFSISKKPKNSSLNK